MGKFKTQLARFKNEARAAASLVHANVVPVYAVDKSTGERAQCSILRASLIASSDMKNLLIK